MSMTAVRFPVAVIIERMPLANRWVSERWEPVAVVPRLAPRRRRRADAIADDADAHALALRRVTRSNCTAPKPKAITST